MTFAGTYQEEVIQSRRIRSKRVLFWARIVSLMLMLTFAATLRSEPELRSALMNAGTEGVMKLVGQKGASIETNTEDLPEATLPKDKVKVTRFGHANDKNVHNAQDATNQLGQALANRRAGG